MCRANTAITTSQSDTQATTDKPKTERNKKADNIIIILTRLILIQIAIVKKRGNDSIVNNNQS